MTKYLPNLMKNIITAKRWKEELNSEAFASGLERTIDFTRKTGMEAGFEIWYDKKLSMFLYPYEIIVGHKDKVDLNNPLNSYDVRKKYEEETGEKLSKTKENSPQERLEKIAHFVEWKKKYNQTNHSKATIIDYPNSEDYDRRLETLQEAIIDCDDSLEGNLMDTAIVFNTHPKREIAIPSPGDLASLNFLRENNTEETSGFNPVEFIAGTAQISKKRQVGYPILIIQEKSEQPLSQNTDWENMHYGFREILTSALGMFGMTTGGSPALQTAQNYRLIEGVYVPNKKRIMLLRGKWDQLES